jgi:branched-chain amino acid transport system substrate-binding protein
MASRRSALALAAMLVALVGAAAQAQKSGEPGVTKTEIRLGQTIPYSGPLARLSAVGKVETAYFRMVNEQGGVNGRMIRLVSVDDGDNPARTIEQTRKLVEGDDVFAIVSPMGTATNVATRRYLNDRKVPQLFVSSGATQWGDPEHFPWTMGFQPNAQLEARIYAKYILQNKPDGKIGILYQNDDFGKDFVKGLKEGLGDQAERMIVSEVSYETNDTTIDSQIVTLQASGADILYDITLPKFAAQAIRKVYDLGWHPLHILDSGSTSVSTVLKPAGLDKSIGILSAQFLKDPANPAWADDPGFREWLAFMKKYDPDGDRGDRVNATGYSIAQTIVQVLKQCGDDLTRENLMKQAANIKDLKLPMLIPGNDVDTAPDNFFPVSKLNMVRFDGTAWALEGPLIGD